VIQSFLNKVVLQKKLYKVENNLDMRIWEEKEKEILYFRSDAFP
jgi:hypothetical protein